MSAQTVVPMHQRAENVGNLDLAQVQQEMLTVAAEIRAAGDELAEALDAAARARWAYRKAKAQAFTSYKVGHRESGSKPTDKDADAHVDSACADLGLARDLAEAREYSAKQLHRALLDLLSALQTRAGMLREEAKFERHTPAPGR